MKLQKEIDESSGDQSWSEISLGEVVNIVTGNNFPSEKYTEDGVPLIRISNIGPGIPSDDNLKYLPTDIMHEVDEKYVLERDDILMAMSGATTGKVSRLPPSQTPALLNQRIAKFEASNRINHHFLLFCLQSHDFQRYVSVFASGGAQDNISSYDLERIKIPRPPLEEQRKIASVLYTVDQAIQKTEDIIKQTERLHTGLRRELVIAGIDHDEFQDMRVGPFTFEIPASWDIVPVDEACENLDKDRIPVKEAKREDMQGDIPYYGASGVIDYVDDYLFDDELILLAEDGENLLSRNLPIAFKISGEAWVNNHAHVLKPRQEFDTDYLVEYFERLNYEPFVTGSAQPKLTQTSMEMLSVPKPPEEEQAENSSVLTSVSIHKNSSEEYKEKLQRLKQGLMQDLLSGEVRTHDKDIELVDDVLQHG